MMRGYIHYVEGYIPSENQARASLKSFKKYGWNDIKLRVGYTPKTLPEEYLKMPIVPNGRMSGWKSESDPSYIRKLSCLANQIRLWREVVEHNETMSFIEHDAVCIGQKKHGDFDELLCYNIDYAFEPPSACAVGRYKGYKPPITFDPKPLPKDYLLKYYKSNVYEGHSMIAGTAHYAVTPKGASKLLNAITKTGIDQSDFFINTYNVAINYISPSTTKLHHTNLNLSNTSTWGNYQQ